MNFLSRNKVLEGAQGKGREEWGSVNQTMLRFCPRRGAGIGLFFMFLELLLKAVWGGKKQIVFPFCVMSS